jgi:SAM-dependent methyltransferase
MKIDHSDIISLNKTFIEVNYTDEYKNRYLRLPVEKNNKRWKWQGKDFPRVIALLEFENYIQKYNISGEKLLIFNGEDDPELEYLVGRIKKAKNINYEDDTANNDLHSLNLTSKDYDLVLLHQTLEHVYNPILCLANIFNHMNKGAYLYINVPACNAPHSEPFHYFTGFTPIGLLLTAIQAGFKPLEIGQWGNEEYLVKLWTRKPGWSDFTQLENPGLNQIQNPVITWGLFQK